MSGSLGLDYLPKDASAYTTPATAAGDAIRGGAATVRDWWGRLWGGSSGTAPATPGGASSGNGWGGIFDRIPIPGAAGATVGTIRRGVTAAQEGGASGLASFTLRQGERIAWIGIGALLLLVGVWALARRST